MTILWNEVSIWWNEVTTGWNEVAWNEVVMEQSERDPFVYDTTGYITIKCFYPAYKT